MGNPLSFNGRIGRHVYLLVTVPLAFIYLVWVAWWLFTMASFPDEGPARIFRMSAAGWVVCAWPYLAAGVKRCHDRGRSGLWYLGWTAGCLGFWAAAIFVQPWLVWPGNLIALWTLVEMGFVKGMPSPNRYGPAVDEGGHLPDPS